MIRQHAILLTDKMRYEHEIMMRVKAFYLQELQIELKNWQLERAVYVLKKLKINVNFVSLASIVYLLYKYDYGIRHLDFVLVMNESRERWRKIFKAVKKKLILNRGSI
ncbi:hypothetical protein AAGT10_14945 (plasmid) [Sulfolobus tengchongensis]